MKRGRLRSETRQTGRPLYYPSFQLVREEAHAFQLVREESHAFQLSFKWARRAIFAPNWSNKLKSRSRTFGAQTQKNGARALRTHRHCLGQFQMQAMFYFFSFRQGHAQGGRTGQRHCHRPQARRVRLRLMQRGVGVGGQGGGGSVKESTSAAVT